jgi:hypothetical protein
MVAYTPNDLPALEDELRREEEDYATNNKIYGTSRMDKLPAIICLLKCGCREVVDSQRGLLVNGRFLVGRHCWAINKRAPKWYPYRNLAKLADRLARSGDSGLLPAAR